MKLAIPGWDIPTLAVAGSDQRIAVRRVFCMGLNYHDHKKEMGITTDVPPFVFTKATWHAIGCAAERVTDMAALQNGANILRAHDVKEAMQTVQLFNQYHHAAV